MKMNVKFSSQYIAVSKGYWPICCIKPFMILCRS